jgi:hypothetical protein
VVSSRDVLRICPVNLLVWANSIKTLSRLIRKTVGNAHYLAKRAKTCNRLPKRRITKERATPKPCFERINNNTL